MGLFLMPRSGPSRWFEIDCAVQMAVEFQISRATGKKQADKLAETQRKMRRSLQLASTAGQSVVGRSIEKSKADVVIMARGFDLRPSLPARSHAAILPRWIAGTVVLSSSHPTNSKAHPCGPDRHKRDRRQLHLTSPAVDLDGIRAVACFCSTYGPEAAVSSSSYGIED